MKYPANPNCIGILISVRITKTKKTKFKYKKMYKLIFFNEIRYLKYEDSCSELLFK